MGTYCVINIGETELIQYLTSAYVLQILLIHDNYDSVRRSLNSLFFFKIVFKENILNKITAITHLCVLGAFSTYRAMLSLS